MTCMTCTAALTVERTKHIILKSVMTHSFQIMCLLSDFCSLIGPYLFHLAALPLACRACDFDSYSTVIPAAPQSHAVGLQWAEGDLQLRSGETAGPAVLCGDL